MTDRSPEQPASPPEVPAPAASAQKRTKNAVIKTLGIAVLVVVGLIVIFGILSLVTTAALSVFGAVFGALGGVAAGILNALNTHDLLPWYSEGEAQIAVELYRYCAGDAYCEAYNVGAGHGVRFWNELMRHKVARVIVAFAFPIIAAAIVKKIIDELWDQAKGKAKARDR